MDSPPFGVRICLSHCFRSASVQESQLASWQTDILSPTMEKNSANFFGWYLSIKTGWWFQIFFNFRPYLGKIPILTHIFQMS